MITQTTGNTYLNDQPEQHNIEKNEVDIFAKNDETIQNNDNITVNQNPTAKEIPSETQEHENELFSFVKKLCCEDEQEVSNTSSGFIDIKNLSDVDYEKEEEPIKIIISTPNDENERNSPPDFGSLVDDTLNDPSPFLLEDTSVKVLDSKKAEEYLNDTIDEAILKYESDDQKEYKDAIVQTTPNLTDSFECKCKILEKQPEIPTLESSLSKKVKNDDHEYFFINYKNPMTETSNFSNSDDQPVGTELFQNGKISFRLKGTSRIRLGLSKRARLQ